MTEEPTETPAEAAPAEPAPPPPRAGWMAATALLAFVAIAAIGDLLLNKAGVNLLMRFAEYDIARAGPIALVAGRVVLLALATLATWRIALRYRRTGRRGGIGAMLAVAVLLFLSEAVGTTSAAYRLPIQLKIAAAVAEMDGFELSYDIDKATVEIRGNIAPGLADAIARLDQGSHPVRTIEINSHGGLIEEALAVADLIQERGMRVVSREACDSACIVIAVASDESYAEDNLRFGLHAPYAVADDRSEISLFAMRQSDASYRAYLLSRGLTEALLNEANQYGPDELLAVPARRLVDLGALKGLVPVASK